MKFPQKEELFRLPTFEGFNGECLETGILNLGDDSIFFRFSEGFDFSEYQPFLGFS